MPIITTNNMSEKERFQYRDRAKKGDFYEIEGAFNDTVFVPKSFGALIPLQHGKRTGYASNGTSTTLIDLGKAVKKSATSVLLMRSLRFETTSLNGFRVLGRIWMFWAKIGHNLGCFLITGHRDAIRIDDLLKKVSEQG